MFKGPKNKEINRFGFKIISNDDGIIDIDIDSLMKKTIEIQEDGTEVNVRIALSDTEKTELESALKGYGFNKVIEKKEK